MMMIMTSDESCQGKAIVENKTKIVGRIGSVARE